MTWIRLEITGINELVRGFNNTSKEVQENIRNVVNESALKIQSNAKKNAPVYLGKLRNSIYLNKIIDGRYFLYTVGVSTSYAPYIEFGTGGSVSIPSGYESYAMKFKGKSATGGTLDDFILALMDWVKRKGLAGVYQAKTYNITTRKASKIVRKGGKATRDFEDFGVAFLILRKILKKGINPHPFLIPSYESEKPNLINKIETIFKNIKLK